jgi:hypothetical protein
MTNDEKRIAIAEACGYTETLVGEENVYGRRLLPCGSRTGQDALPDYLNDLNAMHEAFQMLDRFQRITYGRHLQEIVGLHVIGVISDYPHDLGRLAALAHATASQRADAFLLTLGLLE